MRPVAGGGVGASVMGSPFAGTRDPRDYGAVPGLARRRGAGRSARARPRQAWCPGGMDRQPDDSRREDGSPDDGGRPDGPRPGLVGVLWCVVVIVAVLVVGIAIGMLDGR